MSKKLGTGCVLLSLSTFAVANEMPSLFPRSDEAIVAPDQSPSTTELGAMLRELREPSGIDFVVAPEVEADAVAALGGRSWREALGSLLNGYNYATQQGPNGQVLKLFVTGRNGNGGQSFPPAFSVAGAAWSMPERLRQLPPGTVTALNFDPTQLFDVGLGQKAAVALPNGLYSIVHDNSFEHANGDKTWVGYLDGEGTDYRMIVTMGPEGGIGQVLTPGGLFRIEIENGRTWIVDVEAAGLHSQTMLSDDVAENARAAMQRKLKKRRARVRRQAVTTKTVTSPVTAKTTPPAPPPPIAAGAPIAPVTIDVMVLYTSGFGSGAAQTRLNFLMAATNQAYVDSKVNILLRLVYSQQVNYSSTTANGKALDDITNGVGVFSGVETLRRSKGADLVALLRPFSYSNHQNCGSAWVGGANGVNFRSSLGYSAISDGIDTATRYYCTNYTFAHELGHNMGSAHDVAHAGVAGKYPYSYGNGRDGVFGTIMSYYSPQLGYFSNPAILCKGYSCGIANQADNARSLNSTASSIAAFMPTKP